MPECPKCPHCGEYLWSDHGFMGAIRVEVNKAVPDGEVWFIDQNNIVTTMTIKEDEDVQSK